MLPYKHHLSLVTLFILSIAFGVTIGYDGGRVSFPSAAGAADCSALSTLGACQAQVQCTVVYDFDCTALASQPSCDANAGSGCSSVIHDCSQHDDNEPACTAAVCTFNANDCAAWNGDEGNCVANGCSYDGDLTVCSGTASSGSCTGDYFERCDGTDGTGFAGCTGTYPLCGDGVPDVGEACDDGNATNDDYCTNACTNNGSCGDGARQAGAEACDDGNATNDDYCTNACANNGSCGDGVRQAGAEACDDGNTSDGDYCNSSCTAETGSCGDSITQANEACDDGNATNDDYCTNACTNNGSCGDGARQAGAEACDDGNATNDDYCTNACTNNGSCGDGVRQAGAEACDDGDSSSGDGCSASCAVETGYSCDNASPNACTTTCGDGLRAGAEACDDGGTSSGDGCSASCAVETGYSCDNASPNACTTTCGDAIVTGSETCDDGDTSSGDGCSATCSVEDGWSCDNDPLPSTCEQVFDCGGEPCQGLLSYGGHEYYRFDTPMTWSDARDSCESVDAYLVTITDADEQVQMRDFTSGLGQFWIGLSDTATEGVFTWVTGETYAYSNWADSQPDNSSIGEDCVELNHVGFQPGAWNDTPCNDSDLAGYICEAGFCGDGLVTGSETCDDGDTTPGDGCSATCTVESGYSCLSQPSSCATTCGDGLRAGAEACDDGGTSSGDGCSAACAVEDGWSCDNDAPNVCTEDPASSASSSSSVASSAEPSSASSSVASSAGPSSSSAANSVTISSAATQGGGGGRGGTRDSIRAPAEGRTTGVMSNTAGEQPVTRPAAPSRMLRDVKRTDAARPDIQKVTRKGIMTGYADENGQSKGVFGASDPLTYGQIAKIAVIVGDMDPIASGPLKNRTAKGDWSESYVRAAEQQNLPAFKAVVNVSAAPSKKVVIETLLKASGIAYGSDKNAALEKAKQLGITSDINKRALTRRETAIILSKILSITADKPSRSR